MIEQRRVILMKERKTSKGQITIIIILLLLLIANISYIAYDKFMLEKNTEKEEKPRKEEKQEDEDIIRPLSLAEQKILLEQIKGYNKNLAYAYPISHISKLSNQEILLFAYKNMENKNQKEFMQADIKKIIEYYFGKENNIVYETIYCDKNDGELYVYNDTTKIYTSSTHGHGGGGVYNATSYYIDGEVKNEAEYIIKVHLIYDRYCGDTCGPLLKYYRNKEDAKSGQNPIITREEEKELTKEDYEKVKSELETTIFHFQKDKNGNYGLISVEIEK